MASERRLRGLGVSPGVGIGTVHAVESGLDAVPEYRIAAGQVDAERARLKAAVGKSIRQLRRLSNKATTKKSNNALEELDFLLEAHRQMLSDSRLVRGAAARIGDDKINAEAAVQAEVHEIGKGFDAIDDTYIAARMQDVRDVGGRLIRNLTKRSYRAFARLPKSTVVVAAEISPADAALMDPDIIAAFATELGGAASHAAIVARSLGVPAVLGVPGLSRAVTGGEIVVVDGSRGLVIVEPAEGTIQAYRAEREMMRRQRRTLARLRDLPAVTLDGVDVALQANLELPIELDAAKQVGAAGIGLLRSEFMFMNRDSLPNEDEQYRGLRDIIEAMDGKPVTVRTLDLGSDKLAPALGDNLGAGDNPALGLRAIRLSLSVPGLLESQLSAILRAGARGPVRILLPMISTMAEVREVRKALDKVYRRLVRRRIAVADPVPPLGVMIEVPAAALAADGLARVADFFSIGTNDLTMYALAIDRGNDQVARLYDPLHPAVLRLIQFATEAALRARIPVNICGEVAGDPRLTALLLGLGLRDLSMVAANLPRVKQRIRHLDLTEAMRRTSLIMDQTDPGRIVTLLDDFNSLV